MPGVEAETLRVKGMAAEGFIVRVSELGQDAPNSMTALMLEDALNVRMVR